jgi:hypothetical protein
MGTPEYGLDYERSFELHAKPRVAEMRVELLGDRSGEVAE